MLVAKNLIDEEYHARSDIVIRDSYYHVIAISIIRILVVISKKMEKTIGLNDVIGDFAAPNVHKPWLQHFGVLRYFTI